MSSEEFDFLWSHRIESVIKPLRYGMTLSYIFSKCLRLLGVASSHKQKQFSHHHTLLKITKTLLKKEKHVNVPSNCNRRNKSHFQHNLTQKINQIEKKSKNNVNIKRTKRNKNKRTITTIESTYSPSANIKRLKSTKTNQISTKPFIPQK